jgi:hypothetical protein
MSCWSAGCCLGFLIGTLLVVMSSSCFRRPFAVLQTGFSRRSVGRQYDYTLRRRALRSSWFPQSKEALQNLSDKHGVVVRFVIGHSGNSRLEAAIDEEDRLYGGFLRLPIQARPATLSCPGQCI